ncbi:MAG: acyl-CoA dehydrogenase family protein [Acetobacteraceae bacterium]|jgi:alkylation response protein AidB-like acyl-CoA dehydrogenase
MLSTASSSFIDAAKELAPQIQAFADEIEQSRRLPPSLVAAMAQAGLFRLWIPRALGGEETDPLTFVRVIEEISKADGAAGWCVALCGGNNIFGGYLPEDAAREIYGGDPDVRTAGAFRPTGDAIVVDGGYRVTGQWPLASGCQHSNWIVGGCRILDGDQPRLRPDGTPITRILFFPAAECEILDTWHSIGLRGTGSHDFAVADVFVPVTHSLSLREPPVEPGPLYALPTIALFSTGLAAVALGIARHAIDILTTLAGTKMASRSRQSLRDDSTLQANLGRAEALLRSGRAFVHDVLGEAWEVANAGRTVTLAQRGALWLASTHAANTAKEATELVFSAGGSASPYTSSGLERCVRDIHAVGQHLLVAAPNYQMVGQALLGVDVRATPLLSLDDRSVG